HAFTRDGTLVDLYDRSGIQPDDAARGMRFEAGWGADGATCVARVRIPENATLEELGRRNLAAHLAAACSEDRAREVPGNPFARPVLVRSRRTRPTCNDYSCRRWSHAGVARACGVGSAAGPRQSNIGIMDPLARRGNATTKLPKKL